MDVEQQNKFLQEGSADGVTIGNIAEQEIIELLRSFSKVKQVWKDTSNSKFDLYFNLINENLIRGLQVKAITKRPDRSSYRISGLDKYNDGMLIVGSNKEIGIGLLFISSEHTKMKMASISLNSKLGVISRLVMIWSNFVKNLENNLTTAPIVTAGVFEKSMPASSFLEYNSIGRFLIYCQKFGFNVRIVENNSSHTDLLVDGRKAQMKYVSKPHRPSNGDYFYKVSLSKSRHGGKNGIPYNKGDNDLYIVEIGDYPGDFFIATESILIEKGYIKTETKPGKGNLNVFPYDYLEKSENKNNLQIKGNWTCNKKYWLSTNHPNGHFN